MGMDLLLKTLGVDPDGLKSAAADLKTAMQDAKGNWEEAMSLLRLMALNIAAMRGMMETQLGNPALIEKDDDDANE